MTTAIGWVRGRALPDREGIEITFTDLMEMQVAPEDAELLVCDLLTGLGILYQRTGRWPDYLRLVGQFADVLTIEPGLECQPDAG